ncbi:MAG: hypothetical protein ACM3OC_06710 [Deltaproteobacteria bacterium]
MKALKPAFIALLSGITIFSGYKYFSSLQEKFDLQGQVKLADEQVTALRGEKAALSHDLESSRIKEKALTEENAGLQQQLKVSQEDLLKLKADLQAAQTTVEDLNNQISLAKAENAALVRQAGELRGQTDAAVKEKELLAARLSSLIELKKAIHDLKRKLGGARHEITQRLEQEHLVLGNGGYMIKDGKTTFPTRIKIEVVPLPAPAE